MRAPFSKSLQMKFMLINIPLIFIVIVVAFGIFEYTEFNKSKARLMNKQFEIMDSQVIILAEPLSQGDHVQVILNLATIIATDERIVGARVDDADGNEIALAGIAIDQADQNYVLSQPIRFADGVRFRTVGVLITAASDQKLWDDLWRRSQLAVLFAAIVSVTIIIGSQLVLGYSIMAPLRRLFENMEETTGEGRPAPINWSSKDEIGVLIDSFNRMQSRQNIYERELTDARASLELRVIERTRELMKARDQAEAANSAKSRFLTTMTHELRSPMNTILGFARLIKDAPYGPIGDEKYVDHIEDISASGESLLRIIDDILDLSKAESGALELNEQLVSLSEITTAVQRELTSLARAADVKIVLENMDSAPLILADGSRIRQVFYNLISNAIKYNEAGGSVWVEHSVAGDQLMVRVRDAGIGIAPEHVKQVLEPFGQIDTELSRSHGGTGLGLALSNSLIKLHNGSLSLDSQLGKGTIITIVFPSEIIVDPQLVGATSISAAR